MTVLILGAGPAGLSAAYELCERGVPCTVLEADRIVGGLARTETYRGYHYDVGGHRFFTKHDDIQRLWRAMLGDDLLTVQRLSRIYYANRYYYYPLRLFNAFAGLGFVNSLRITLSYLRARALPVLPEESFEDYVVNRFGRRLYEIFFKTYTEKVWGIPCHEIDWRWAAQRIRGLSFASAIWSALHTPHRPHIKSLIEQFEYPRLGPGQLWQRFASHVETHGGRVQLQAPVVRVQRQGTHIESVAVLRDGQRERIAGSHVISTLALRDFIAMLDPPAPDDVRRAASALRYRDFLVALLILRQREVFPDQWLYIHTPRAHVGRIQNFKQWSAALTPDMAMTHLGFEYFATEGDTLWSMSDVELIELAKRELEFLRLARAADVMDGAVKRMKKAYPVYDATYRENLAIVRGYLDAFDNLQTVGRNGLHKYNNQDHSMLTGILAARNLCGEQHDVWAVNTDLEYQEEMRING
jgi:protoporphyrinogen oxidase